MKKHLHIALTIIWIAKSIFFPIAIYILILNHQPYVGQSINILVPISTEYIVDDDELILNGEYYDIISHTNTSEGILFNCVDDPDETNYHHSLSEEQTAEKNNKGSFEKLKQLEETIGLSFVTGNAPINYINFDYPIYEQSNTYSYEATVFIPPQLRG